MRTVSVSALLVGAEYAVRTLIVSGEGRAVPGRALRSLRAPG
ncbi:hypothetical protein ACQP2X_23160 [Actinoplanes sp. CA-131856]